MKIHCRLLILMPCLVPAEPRTQGEHRRQEWPASLGREPEPGMLDHEKKSADRSALLYRLHMINNNHVYLSHPYRGRTNRVSRASREQYRERRTESLGGIKKQRKGNVMKIAQQTDMISDQRCNYTIALIYY